MFITQRTVTISIGLRDHSSDHGNTWLILKMKRVLKYHNTVLSSLKLKNNWFVYKLKVRIKWVEMTAFLKFHYKL